MKIKGLLIIFLLVTSISCIRIENDPLVTVSPFVEFQAHIRSDKVYATAIIAANPTFIDPGNIPTVFSYEGKFELYNEVSGALLAQTEIEGSGLNSVIEAVASAEDFENMILIASGSVSAYADKDSDGDRSNDLFLHTSSFYEVTNLSEVINIQNYPVVVLDPGVDFQWAVRNKQLYTTATIRANPDYIVTGIDPIVFEYDGVMQLYDELSGILLKSSSLSGDGLSQAVTIANDTTGFDGFIIIVSGVISCRADIGSDGEAGNDLPVSSAEFNDILIIDLDQDV